MTPSTSSRRPKPPPSRWLWTGPSPAAGRWSSRPPPARAPSTCVPTQTRSRPCGRERCSSSAPSSHARGTAPGRPPRPCVAALAMRLRRRRRRSARPRRALSDAASMSLTMLGRAELGVRAVVPFDLERRESFLRRPHVVGDDRDGVVESNDLAHALDGLAFASSTLRSLPAEHGRYGEGRDLHARQPRRRCRRWPLPLTLPGVSRRLAGVPISLKSSALERDALGGHRQLARRRDQLAILESPSRRPVDHFAALGAAGRRIDFPPLRRRRHEHRSRGSTRLAQRLPRRAHRVRVAGGLDPPSRDCCKACRLAAHARAHCFRATSSSSAISIGMEV